MTSGLILFAGIVVGAYTVLQWLLVGSSRKNERKWRAQHTVGTHDYNDRLPSGCFWFLAVATAFILVYVGMYWHLIPVVR
jgi:hypothetical protein